MYGKKIIMLANVLLAFKLEKLYTVLHYYDILQVDILLYIDWLIDFIESPQNEEIETSNTIKCMKLNQCKNVSNTD